MTNNLIFLEEWRKFITIIFFFEVLGPQHIYNTFIINYRWQVVTDFNLNLQIKLLFTRHSQ